MFLTSETHGQRVLLHSQAHGLITICTDFRYHHDNDLLILLGVVSMQLD